MSDTKKAAKKPIRIHVNIDDDPLNQDWLHGKRPPPPLPKK